MLCEPEQRVQFRAIFQGSKMYTPHIGILLHDMHLATPVVMLHNHGIEQIYKKTPTSY